MISCIDGRNILPAESFKVTDIVNEHIECIQLNDMNELNVENSSSKKDIVTGKVPLYMDCAYCSGRNNGTKAYIKG